MLSIVVEMQLESEMAVEGVLEELWKKTHIEDLDDCKLDLNLNKVYKSKRAIGPFYKTQFAGAIPKRKSSSHIKTSSRFCIFGYSKS